MVDTIRIRYQIIVWYWKDIGRQGVDIDESQGKVSDV